MIPLLPQSAILFSYMGVRYAKQVLLALLILSCFLYFLDVTELARRMSERDADFPIWQVMLISLLKLPSLLDLLLPFSILFGSISCFFFWSRSHEFTISRAIGQTIWSALYPVYFVAFLFGIIHIALINPIAAATSSQYDRWNEEIFGKTENNISISTSGLWLKDTSAGNNYIINGAQLNIEDETLSSPVIYQLQENGLLSWRMTAELLRFTDGGWVLTNVTKTNTLGGTEILGDVILPSEISTTDIFSNRQSAHTVPFYRLPSFISLQKQAGFPIIEHQVFMHQLFATPFEFIGIAMIAAAITLSQFSRMFRIRLIIYGICSGFGFYFLSDLSYLLGSTAKVPYLFAGYGPALIMCLMGFFWVARIDE